MTSPDPEVERLQREYEQACVAYCEKILPGACFEIRDPAGELGLAAAHAGMLLQQARQRASSAKEDEEIISVMREAMAISNVDYHIETSFNILSALRAAGFEIKRR